MILSETYENEFKLKVRDKWAVYIACNGLSNKLYDVERFAEVVGNLDITEVDPTTIISQIREILHYNGVVCTRKPGLPTWKDEEAVIYKFMDYNSRDDNFTMMIVDKVLDRTQRQILHITRPEDEHTFFV